VPCRESGFRANCLCRGLLSRACSAGARSSTCMTAQALLRRRLVALSLQCLLSRSRPRCRGTRLPALPFGQILLRLPAHLRRTCSGVRCTQVHTSSPGFREPYSDRLFCRASAVLAFSYMVHFFTYEFTRLGTGRFAFACIFPCFLNSFPIGHRYSLIPVIRPQVIEGRRGVYATRSFTSAGVSAFAQ